MKILKPSDYTFEDYQKLTEIETDEKIKNAMLDNLRLIPKLKFKAYSNGKSLVREQYELNHF